MSDQVQCRGAREIDGHCGNCRHFAILVQQLPTDLAALMATLTEGTEAQQAAIATAVLMAQNARKSLTDREAQLAAAKEQARIMTECYAGEVGHKVHAQSDAYEKSVQLEAAESTLRAVGELRDDLRNARIGFAVNDQMPEAATCEAIVKKLDALLNANPWGLRAHGQKDHAMINLPPEVSAAWTPEERLAVAHWILDMMRDRIERDDPTIPVLAKAPIAATLHALDVLVTAPTAVLEAQRDVMLKPYDSSRDYNSVEVPNHVLDAMRSASERTS